jgi:hypothetical protein
MPQKSSDPWAQYEITPRAKPKVKRYEAKPKADPWAQYEITPRAKPKVKRYEAKPKADPWAQYEVPTRDTTQAAFPSVEELTANPIDPKTGQGKGLYAMYGRTGKGEEVGQIQIPYDKVPQALEAGYTWYGGSEDTYKKDKEAEGKTPSWWGTLNDRFQKAIQPDPNETGDIRTHKNPAIDNTDRAFLRVLYGTPGALSNVAKTWWAATQGTGSVNEFLDTIDPSVQAKQMYDQFRSDWKKNPELAMNNLEGTVAGLATVGAITHRVGELTRGRGETATPEVPVRSSHKAVNELIDERVKEEHEAQGRELSYQQELRTKAEEIRIKDQAELAKLHEDTRKAAEVVREANRKAREAATEDKRKAAVKFWDEARKKFHETEGLEIAHKHAIAERAEQIRMEEAREAADIKARHEAAVEKVRKENRTAKAAAEQKEAMESLWRSKEPQVKKELKITEDEVNAEANKKYNDIRAKIGKEEVPAYQKVGPDGHIVGEPVPFLQHIYDNAVAKITDWTNDPTLLKKLGERVSGKGVGDPGNPVPTYAELQELRTKVGSALRGNLPSDQFYAYKGMMEDIDEGMQQVADAHGEGEAQALAREYYKAYADAFLDYTSPIYKAIHSGIEAKTGDLFRGFKDRDAALEALARYNPDLAGTIKTLTETQDRANEIKLGDAQPEPVPPHPRLTSGSAEERAAQEVKEPERVPPPKIPPPIKAEETPEPPPPPPRLTSGSPEERAAQEVNQPEGQAPGRKINLSDIKGARREAYQRGVDLWVRNRGRYLAIWPAIGLLRTMLHGSGFPLGEAALESGGLLLASQLAAKALENPRVAEFFTKATVRDIQAVPPSLRGDLPMMVKATRANGVKVSPALIALTVSASRPKKQKTIQ